MAFSHCTRSVRLGQYLSSQDAKRPWTISVSRGGLRALFFVAGKPHKEKRRVLRDVSKKDQRARQHYGAQ
jgi:hypothetical protein